jgi:hypothetical protein
MRQNNRYQQVQVAGAIALCGALIGAVPAGAEGISVVVSRGDASVELFVGMPARTAVDAFGLPPHLLEQPDGTVDFTGFSQGTWDMGDALFAGVTTTIGDTDVQFEGMSVMVHLTDQRLPLETPLDGLTAISVCGVEPPAEPQTLDDLYLYAGLIGYTPDPQAVLQLHLPQDRQDTIEVRVRDYQQGQLMANDHVALDLTMPLTVGNGGPWRPQIAGLGLSLAVFLTVAGLLLWRGLVLRDRRAVQADDQEPL